MDFKKAFFMGAFSASAVAGAVFIADKALNRVVKGTLADDTLVEGPNNNYIKKEPEKTVEIPEIKIQGQTVAQPVIEPVAVPVVEEPAAEPVVETIEQQPITEPMLSTYEQTIETPEEEPLKPFDTLAAEPAVSIDLPEEPAPQVDEEPAYNPYLSIKPPYEVAPILPEDQVDEKAEHEFKAPEADKVSEPVPQDISNINIINNSPEILPVTPQFSQAEPEPELMVTPGLPYIAGKLDDEDEPKQEEKQTQVETNAPLLQFETNAPLPQTEDNYIPTMQAEVNEIPAVQVELNAPLPQQEINEPSEPEIKKTTKTQVIGSNTVSDEEDNGAILAVSHSNPGVDLKNLVSIMAEDNTGLVFEFSNDELRDETTLINVYSITPDGKAVLPPEEQKNEILKFGKTFITDKQELRAFLAK